MFFMKTRHLEQEKLLEKLTNFIQMYWDETLDLEMSDITDQCSKSDTDFEFVIDQSGSGKGLFVRRFCDSSELHNLWTILDH